jgi:hypothetical protein
VFAPDIFTLTAKGQVHILPLRNIFFLFLQTKKTHIFTAVLISELKPVSFCAARNMVEKCQ